MHSKEHVDNNNNNNNISEHSNLQEINLNHQNFGSDTSYFFF